MIHSVKSGETLSAIANQHGTSVATLVRLNPAISDPNRIAVGQSINLPAENPRQFCAVGQIQSQSGCAPEPFELAFYWNNRPRTRSEIYKEIYGEAMNFRLRSLFDRNNTHLQENVLPGEIVIVSNMPVTAQDRDKLELLREQARLASSGIQELSSEEAATVKRHIEIFDQLAATQSASLGVISAAAGTRLRDLNQVLADINQAYIRELSANPGARTLSPQFLAERRALFNQLDNAVNRVTISALNIRQYDRVKHTLGLSTKSILHNASEIIDGGQVPQLGRRIEMISRWAKGASRLGWLGIGIDAGLRATRVSEACTAGSDSKCTVVSFQQSGGFLGAAAGGSIGGLFLGKGAAVVAGTVALAFGVTLGAPVVALIAITGAAVGAYGGGSIGSAVGENAGERIGEIFYTWSEK